MRIIFHLNLGTGQAQVSACYFKGFVAQNPLQCHHITAIHQVSYGEAMPKQVSMEAVNSARFLQSVEHRG